MPPASPANHEAEPPSSWAPIARDGWCVASLPPSARAQRGKQRWTDGQTEGWPVRVAVGRSQCPEIWRRPCSETSLRFLKEALSSGARKTQGRPPWGSAWAMSPLHPHSSAPRVSRPGQWGQAAAPSRRRGSDCQATPTPPCGSHVAAPPPCGARVSAPPPPCGTHVSAPPAHWELSADSVGWTLIVSSSVTHMAATQRTRLK